MYIADLEICTPLSNDLTELNEKIQANENEFCLSDYMDTLASKLTCRYSTAVLLGRLTLRLILIAAIATKP